MTQYGPVGIMLVCGFGGQVYAQAAISRGHEQLSVAAQSGGASSGVGPSMTLIAALEYDASSTWGMRGQDFESAYDLYDIFIIEDFGPLQDAMLEEFQSVGFGNVNPFGTQDVGVRIFENNGTGLPG